MCLSVEELLFIVSPPSYSSGAGLSHTLSLYLSHYLALCLLPPPLHLSPPLFISLIPSLPLSHPHSHSPRQENKGDLATYLVCFCLRACVMLRAQPTELVSSTDTEITGTVFGLLWVTESDKAWTGGRHGNISCHQAYQDWMPYC